MKKFPATVLAISAAAALNAAEVSVGSFACNPGALVRVPVSLSGTAGICGVAVTVSYDPQVVVCSRVSPGTLESPFGDGFTGVDDGAGGAHAAIFTIGGNAPDPVSGTVADFWFLARNGTAGQFSDITVTKVELMEESGVRDVTVDDPVTVVNGMVRVLAEDAAAARFENAQTVVAGTRLGSLALSWGDAIQASDDGSAIVVSGAVAASSGAVSVAAPDFGWATATYTLLQTPTSGLSFVAATNAAERLPAVETRSGGISTYSLAVEGVGGVAVHSRDGALDGSLQAYVRECSAGFPGVTDVWVSGGADAVSLARAFGIRPAFSASGSAAEAGFAKPALRVTAFDPAAGTVTAAVEPQGGTRIAGEGKVTGIVEVLGCDSLGEDMIPADRVEIDLSSYFAPDTAGQIDCRVSFGDKRFFQVRIADE